MSPRFSKVIVIPKLDAVDSHLVKEVCNVVQRAAQAMSVQWLNSSDYNQVDEHTLIIAVGGDGTMLEAMRLSASKNGVATGINLGKVGFLTDFEYNYGFVGTSWFQLESELKNLFLAPSEYPLEARMALTLKDYVYRGYLVHDAHHAFNEFVFSNVESDGIIRYHLEVNDDDAGYHKANAVIIGTPTGSTAYTLSNGGSLLYPSMSVMQIVPVAPLSMTSRPIIVPGYSTVRITVEADKWNLRGDGVKICTFEGNGFGPSLEVTEYEKKALVLHTKQWNFFDMLANKLHWKRS